LTTNPQLQKPAWLTINASFQAICATEPLMAKYATQLAIALCINAGDSPLPFIHK